MEVAGGGRHRAEQLVVAAGPWMADLLPETKVDLPSCCDTALFLYVRNHTYVACSV